MYNKKLHKKRLRDNEDYKEPGILSDLKSLLSNKKYKADVKAQAVKLFEDFLKKIHNNAKNNVEVGEEYESTEPLWFTTRNKASQY